MASKAGQPEAEKVDIEEALDYVDKTLDRTKVLYEQYFLGMQKQPPTQIHTDVERRLRDLQQLSIRNTGLRYRFATLQQKFGSYNSYWRRTLKQIENGTYIRNLQKISRKAALTGEEIPDEILAAMPKRMRDQVKRDREQAIAIARRRLDTHAGELDPSSDDEGAAMIGESPDVVRQIPRGGAHVVDDADADMDFDAFFASVHTDDKSEHTPANKPAPSDRPPGRPSQPVVQYDVSLDDDEATAFQPSPLAAPRATGSHAAQPQSRGTGSVPSGSPAHAASAQPGGPQHPRGATPSGAVPPPRPGAPPPVPPARATGAVPPIAGQPQRTTAPMPAMPQHPSGPILAQTSAIPTQTSAIPTQTNAFPTQRSSGPIPTQTGAIPTQTSTIPTQTSAIPTQTSAIPTQRSSGSIPTQTSGVPPQRRTGPVPGGPVPAGSGIDRVRTGPVPVIPAPEATQPAPAARASGPIPTVPAIPRPSAPNIPRQAPSQVSKPNPIAPGSSTARPAVPVETMSGPFPRAAAPPPVHARQEAPKVAPKPVAAPVRPPPGMNDADVNALYATYVKAKKAVGEEAGPGAYGKLLQTINAQAPKIMEQYKAKGVEFSVVVKDNQVVIKAKPKT